MVNKQINKDKKGEKMEYITKMEIKMGMDRSKKIQLLKKVVSGIEKLLSQPRGCDNNFSIPDTTFLSSCIFFDLSIPIFISIFVMYSIFSPFLSLFICLLTIQERGSVLSSKSVVYELE